MSSKSDEDHSFVTNFVPIRRITKIKSKDLVEKSKNWQPPHKNRDRRKKFDIENRNTVAKPFFIPCRDKDLAFAAYVKSRRLKDVVSTGDNHLQRKPCTDGGNFIDAVTDIDKYYFSIMNGKYLARPLHLYKRYKVINDKIMIMRQETVFKLDVITHIDEQYGIEKFQYEKANRMCTQQLKYFEIFLSENFVKSKEILIESENMAIELNIITSEYHRLSSKIHQLRSSMSMLNERHEIQKRIENFLFFISPPSWKQKMAPNKSDKESELLSVNTLPSDGHYDYTTTSKIYLINSPKPQLYFTDPLELLTAYEVLEQQYLEYFRYVLTISTPMAQIKADNRAIKQMIQNECQFITESIDDLNKKLEDCNKSSAQLENKFRSILHGEYFSTVASVELLKLSTYLRYCYENVSNQRKYTSTLSNRFMIKYLEAVFFSNCKALDYVDNRKIKRAIVACFEEDVRKMRDAVKARNELRSFDKFKKRLNQAYLSPTKWKKVIFTVPKRIKKNFQGKDEDGKFLMQRLTQQEREYLTFFTDWCSGDDPTPFLDSKYRTLIQEVF